MVKTVGSDRTAGSDACCVRSSTGTSADLPVVAMHHVRQPDALHEFDGHARKFRKALGVIGIVAALVAIEVFAVEKSRDRRRKNSARPACDCPSTMAGNRMRIAEGDAQAGNQRGGDFVSAVARQQNGDLVPHVAKRFGQRFDHVRQPAGLRIRQSFRRDEQDLHGAPRASRGVHKNVIGSH